jgi:hypothetical protein
MEISLMIHKNMFRIFILLHISLSFLNSVLENFICDIDITKYFNMQAEKNKGVFCEKRCFAHKSRIHIAGVSTKTDSV